MPLVTLLFVLAFAVLMLRSQLSLELAEALHLATLCLHPSGVCIPTLCLYAHWHWSLGFEHSREHVYRLCSQWHNLPGDSLWSQMLHELHFIGFFGHTCLGFYGVLPAQCPSQSVVKELSSTSKLEPVTSYQQCNQDCSGLSQPTPLTP